MATWMKALVVALAAVVGLVPAFARVSAAQAVQEALATLPVGDELSDEELLQTDGEGFWFTILALVMAIAPATAYCIKEAVEGRTPRWQTALALLGWGFVYAATVLYAKSKVDADKTIQDVIPLQYRTLPPENAARWRF
jgi:hypothetical protein